MKVRIYLISLLAIGCTNMPRVNPTNEINQPVFFSGHYMSAGATFGVQSVNNELDSTYQIGPLIEPLLAISGNVNSWASYLFWPLFWNFLLTGEQYSTIGVLKTGKVNLAVFGGMNSIAYSQRDEWEFGVGTGIRAKILFSNTIYSEITTALQLSDFRRLERGYLSTHLTNGFQFSPKNSVALDWTSTLYKIEERRYFGAHGLAFYNQDVNNEIRARLTTYFTANHVLGPEIGYGFLNLRGGRDDYYLIGVTYRYVWR
ncbi:MAG: hypothetical protein JWP91_858 [Fibrobacteres bacterium]|nr:hypothetical protein [Fibrobacterota bacterium]